jgi:hypothetical protein
LALTIEKAPDVGAFSAKPAMTVNPTHFVIGSVLVVYGIAGLLMLWNILKYGEARILPKDSPPSLLGEPAPTFQKGNFQRWLRGALGNFKDQVELARQDQLEKMRKKND